MASSGNSLDGKAYDWFYPSDEVLEVIDHLETRALVACNQYDIGARTYSAPLRFDARVRLHQNHALDATPLVALHGRFQKMGARQTLRLEDIESYYRQALILRSRFPVDPIPKRHRFRKDVGIAHALTMVLEETRLRLFREGTE